MKTKFLWRIRRDFSGETRFYPIEQKNIKKPQDILMYATLTNSIVKNEKIDFLTKEITNNGGNVLSVKGKRMMVLVPEDNTELVGDVFDTLGCQWDTE